MTILVVDDDPHTRALHSHYLRKAGYRVLNAASASDAFELLELSRPQTMPQVELILMDLMMPEIDGLEACRRIQSTEAYRHVPVVFVTAAEPEDSLLAAYESGGVDFITKPVNKEALLGRISGLLLMKRELERNRERVQELKRAPAGDAELVDPITGVASRAHFDASLAEAWDWAQRKDTPLALIVVEADCLKAFQDHYGEERANDLLKRLAASLRPHVGPNVGLLARYGGDSLAVLLRDMGLKEARALAARLRQSVHELAEQEKASGGALSVLVSMGVAAATPRAGGSPDGLCVLAEGAVDCAQSAGRNQAVVAELVE